MQHAPASSGGQGSWQGLILMGLLRALRQQMRLPGEAGRASILAKLLLSHARELYLEVRS